MTTSPASQPQGALTDERAKFEAWAALFGSFERSEWDQSRYAHGGLDLAWEAWQAAALAARPATAAAGVPSDAQWRTSRYGRAAAKLADDYMDLTRKYADLLESSALAAQTATQPASEAVCTVSPAGWICTRVAGHEGPCAARPATEAVQKAWVVANPGTATGIINMLAQQIDDLTESAMEPADEVRGALSRLTAWAQAVHPDVAYSGDHPIAAARNALATPAQPAPAPGAGETQPLTMSMFANRKDFEAAGGKREDAK